MLLMAIERQRLSFVIPKGESLDTQEIKSRRPLFLVSRRPTHAGLSR
jgi:hypothetical protein